MVIGWVRCVQLDVGLHMWCSRILTVLSNNEADEATARGELSDAATLTWRQ